LLSAGEFRAARGRAQEPYALQPPAVGCVTGAPVGWLVADPTGTGGGALVGLPSQPLLWWGPPVGDVPLEPGLVATSPRATPSGRAHDGATICGPLGADGCGPLGADGCAATAVWGINGAVAAGGDLLGIAESELNETMPRAAMVTAPAASVAANL
jgi:hypothetical protein